MAQTKYGSVRLDKVKSVYVGNIHSVVYEDGILENGMVVEVGDLKDGERELHEVVLPTEGSPIALIAMSEVNYDESHPNMKSIQSFYIPEGLAARAYELQREDIFSITKEVFVPLSTMVGGVKGNFVVADGLKLKEIAEDDLTGDEVFLGEIIGKEKIGTPTLVGSAGVISRVIEFIVIRVRKNQ